MNPANLETGVMNFSIATYFFTHLFLKRMGILVFSSFKSAATALEILQGQMLDGYLPVVRYFPNFLACFSTLGHWCLSVFWKIYSSRSYLSKS